MNIEELSYWRQADKWLIDNNFINIHHLENIRNCLLAQFKSLKKVEIECNTVEYKITIFLSLRWIYKFFIHKTQLTNVVRSIVQQYLYKYDITVEYIL